MPRYHIRVIAPSGRFEPCVQYVLQQFARVYGHSVQMDVCPGEDSGRVLEQSATDSGRPAADITVVYGLDFDIGNHSPAGPLLKIVSSGFFKDSGGGGFGSAAAPADFSQMVGHSRGNGFSDIIERRAAHLAELRLDVIAAAFYLLSGYHEWASAQRDNDGRVLSSHIPVPEETWDLPVVNHWFRQLNELVHALITGIDTAPDRVARPPAQQTICLTHDVDFLRKYRTGRAIRQLARTARQPQDFGKAFSAVRKSLGRTAADPYDSFDALYLVKDRVKAPSTFFFLGCGPGRRDGDYRPDSREVRELYTRARTFGDEIALHGSWNSIDDCLMLSREKKAIEQAARVKVLGSRQHYLRFDNPETWKCAAGAGLQYEATGGFPDRAGFRYGWSGCFQPFDLDLMTPLPILEIPLVCMDVTLANYEKIPAELCLERLTNLLDAACDDVPGGAFVFLWHNIMADREQFPGYWDTFEYFFSVASGSARFITLAQLCAEHGGLVDHTC